MKTGTRPDIAVTTPKAKLRLSAQDVLADYRLAVRSRAASELSRREVLVGKAPFGISGEGKEIAQLGMAHAFRPGDWRSGYYRDQTFMFAVGLADLSQYFAQLYADPDVVRDPNSAGRQMLSHFATRTLDERGRFKDLLATGQSASELSPVAAQMPRSVGLAWASRLYRASPAAIGRARLLARRRGGLLRHDRERGDQRGCVLGEPERRGSPADPSGHLGVGRRLWDLGAERVSDDEGLDLRRA